MEDDPMLSFMGFHDHKEGFLSLVGMDYLLYRPHSPGSRSTNNRSMTTTVWHTPPQGGDHLRTRLSSQLFHRARAKEFASGPETETGVLVLDASSTAPRVNTKARSTFVPRKEVQKHLFFFYKICCR